jgi:2'-5' RNA ligase
MAGIFVVLIFLSGLIYGKHLGLEMKSPYYRTFIGLPLQVPASFLESRDKLMDMLREERISWTNPEKYHVTLRFLGDTEPSDIERIGNALKEGIGIPRQMQLATTGLDSFGPRKRPRVIWAGFEEIDFFERLKLDVDRSLDLCGIPFDQQVFRAHLTLGRIRSLSNLERYYRSIEEMKIRFIGSVLFDRLVFFRSILGPRGPEYHVLREILFSS